MGTRKSTTLEKYIQKFIQNNLDKRDRNKNESLIFEWFVNSMHICQCSSQTFNADSKIGKKISLGDSQGGDAFFISVNDYEQIFSLNSDLDEVLKYIKSKGKTVTFHFIQTKKSNSAKWPDFLNLIDIPWQIWEGKDFPENQPILKEVQKFIDAIVNERDADLQKIVHKIELFFYTNKNELDIQTLRNEWNQNIEIQFNKLKEFIPTDNIKIELRGSSDLSKIYEILNSNTYSLSIRKSEIIEVDHKRYLIGYITAKELLDSIAPSINGIRTLYPDVFKNNIRLYLGRNTVNEKIEETLLNEPTYFHYYNNGLTITTKEIKDGNSKYYNISPVNIVNGCQTANSIFNVCKSRNINEESIKIPVKIIVAEDDLYENITIRTNTQNGIEAKDLVSITNIQKELEILFNTLSFQNKKYYYKRQKSSESIDNSIDYIIQIDDILRATFSTLLLIPHKVLGYFDQTTASYIEQIFDEKFTKIYSIITILYKHIETETETTFNNHQRLNFHILYLFYRYVCKDLRTTDKEEQIKIIAEYFREQKKEEFTEEYVNNLENTINSIYSKLYDVLKSEDYFKKVMKYIVSKINSHYPEFNDLSTRERGKILYRPVQKITKWSKTEVFTNFETVFSEQIETFKL